MPILTNPSGLFLHFWSFSCDVHEDRGYFEISKEDYEYGINSFFHGTCIREQNQWTSYIDAPTLNLHPPSVFGCSSLREIYLDSAAELWHARLFGRSTEFLPLEIITEGQIRRYASGRQIIISCSSTNDLRRAVLPTH